MKKIEVLMQLRDVVNTQMERDMVTLVIDSLAEAFHGMIAGTKSVMMGGKPDETGMEMLLPMMKALHETAAHYGVELPLIEDMFALRTYVMEFGIEIVTQA